jgi:NDP-sugar pyrophosphorylase family protein
MAVFYTQEVDVSDFGIVKVKNNRTIDFAEKPDYQYSGYVNAGIYILSPQIFQTKIFKSKTAKNPLSLEKTVFPKLAKEHQLLAYVHRGLWCDIDSAEGMERAENIVERLKE